MSDPWDDDPGLNPESLLSEFGTVNLIYFLLVTAFSIMTTAFVLYTAYTFGYNAEQNGYLFALV